MNALISRSRAAWNRLVQNRADLWRWHLVGWALLTLQTVTPVRAAGSDMPWEEPLQQVLDSIQGPVARIVAVIIIIGTGLTLAFGDTSGGFRRLVQIVFGLSIAFAASSFFLTFFSFTGGAMVMVA
jgi:type IV secretion system protein TrbC